MLPNTQYRAGITQPMVRNACEPCHERKIRCITSTDGGPCDSCQSRRLSCFFLPRARSGRRPNGTNAHHASDSDPNGAGMEQNGTGRRISSPPTPRHDLQNDHFEWGWPLPAEDPDQQRQSTGATTGLLDLDRPLSTARATTNGFGLQPPILEQDETDLTKLDYQSVSMPDAMSFQGTDMPTIAPPTPQRKLSVDIDGRDGTKLGENEFALLLQLCAKLQGHLKQVGGSVPNQAASGPTMTPSMSSAISTTRLRDMLEDISKSCDVIFGVYGQGDLSKPNAQVAENLDHASTSLALAVVFKVFQVCDTVLTCNSLKNQGLNDMLLHKRLDFNLMQARIVAAKIEEMTQGGLAVSRKVAMNANGVEQKFRAIT